MRLKICLIAVLAIGAQAEDRAPKKASAKKQPAPPAELTLPAGAKLIEAGVYTFTDAKGKKWIYRKTPFGLSRAEDKPVETTAARSSENPITASEDGDSVRFERAGPFGPYRWQKKKSELT